MIRPLLWLSALVLGLALADAWLATRASRARDASRRVGALFTRTEAEHLRKQPALRVELSGETHAFGRIEGRWRCLSYHQAPADARAVQALLDGLLQAEGIVHAATSEEAPAYGINTPRTLRVSIQGPRATQDPAGDVLATLEIGLAQPGREACFVRRKGAREIWSIAGDLRAPLERRLAPGLPPLLAPAAVPAEWLEQGGGARRITIQRGAARTVLERRERALDPAEMQPGMLPWSWILDPEGSARELDARVADAFAGFVEHLPYVEVLDAAAREARGLSAPEATLTLEAHTGAPLVLAFGTRDARERVALWVAASATLYQVEASVLALATPETSLLTAEHGEQDPWSAALRATER